MLSLFSHFDVASIKFGDVLSVGLLIVAFVSLIVQQRNLIKQIRLNVFSDSMSLLMNNDKFYESQDYIFSRAFDEDIKMVKLFLDLNDNDNVGLEDFRKILHDNKNPTESEKFAINNETRERLRISYNKIRYLCSRMEYLGVLSMEPGVYTLILAYYGYTITKTYERLTLFIEKTRNNPNSNELYTHYTQLYNLAKEEYIKHK